MSNLPLPLPVEIVCHHIDEVQVLRNLRNIVTAKVSMGFQNAAYKLLDLSGCNALEIHVIYDSGDKDLLLYNSY